MKSKKLYLLVSVILVLTMVFAACGGDDKKAEGGSDTELEPLELTLTIHDPETAATTIAVQNWADKVSEATDGKLTIKIFASGSLAPGAEALNFVMDGTADIGWLYTMYFPGQFPLTEVTALPMNGTTHPVQNAEVLWDLYDATPELQTELSKVKLLMISGNPPNFISTTKAPMASLADIKGLKLRAPAGALTEVMKLWGAAPEVVAPGDAYDALQKGNIGGTTWDWNGIRSFKLQEQLKYVTEAMPVYEGVFLLGMNPAVYEGLPDAYKKVIDETTGRAASLTLAQEYYDGEQKAKSDVIASAPDLKFIEPTADAVAEFKKFADQYADKWVAEHSKDGFDAAAYYAKSKELIEKYKK